MRATVLEARQLSKRYRVNQTPAQRLGSLFGISYPEEGYWALKDVSFSLAAGQCLGVIGDNGAGKSTLLKLLADTLKPSHGSLMRTGRVTAILELGAGFHPDFSGRDNLRFGGGFIGLSPQEMQLLEQEIIDFSELGDAIDRPVKTYSSGMVVRLAFALVTAVQPQVLIVDEALAVGDQHFQKKCIARIDEFRANGCTILFCSHSLYHVRQLCDQVLWLDHGQVRGFGPMEEVLTAYEIHVRMQDAAPASQKLPTDRHAVTPSLASAVQTAEGRAHIQSATITGLQPGLRELLKAKDLSITLVALTPHPETPSMGFMLEQYQGVGIMSLGTHAEGVTPKALETRDGWTKWSMTLTLTDLPLYSGAYVLSFYLADTHGLVIYDEWKDYQIFDWIKPSLTPGLVRLPHVWS